MPPLAVTNAGLKLLASVMSNVCWYVPDVAPVGNPVKPDVDVATPTFVVVLVQQWMCAAVAMPDRPEKDIETVIIDVAGAYVIVAEPTAVEALGGTAATPDNVVVKTTCAKTSGVAPASKKAVVNRAIQRKNMPASR